MSVLLRTLAAALLAVGALAAPAAAAPADDPSLPLVYVFSLDGLDGDRLDQGRAPFIGRLLLGQEDNRATYYRESRSVMVSETNPNHVAMATGAFGDRSGIPGNAFAVYDSAAKAACNGEEDASGEPAATDGELAPCLLAETFFTAAKRRGGGRIVSAGVFGKPKLAQIFAARLADPSSYDADHLWSPCAPRDRSDYCDPSAPARPNDGTAATDAVVMDEVLATVRDGVGTRALRRPNLTFVNLPTIDSAGHGFGTDSGAYDQAIAMADAQIARFVAEQKRLGLWRRTVMFLVSDHAMDTTPSKSSLRGAFTLAGIPQDEVLVVQNGSVDMVYLADRTRPDRDAFLKRLRDVAVGVTGVDEALYRQPNPLDGGSANTLEARHPGWRIAGPRTGDLFVTQRTGGAFNEPNPLTGNHGGPQTSDNTFAVVSGGGQVRQQAIGGQVAPRFDDTLLNPGSAQNVDVAPTVMALLGAPPPLDNEGRVLTEAFEAGVLGAGGNAAKAKGADACAVPRGFRSAGVRSRGRGLRFAFRRAARRPVRVDVFRQSAGRRVIGNRLVARFRGRSRPFTWRGRGRAARAGDGVYLVRMRVRDRTGRLDVRRFVVRRRDGRFRRLAGSERRRSCGLLAAFKLERPVFGGRRNRALSISFRLGRPANVGVAVLRSGKVVRRFRAVTRGSGVTHRLRLPSERIGRGPVTVRITASAGGRRVTARLVARRL